MVRKLLEFNPYFRWSAYECLKSSYFDKVRNSHQEKHPKGKILLEIDQEDAFDYENAKSFKFTKNDFLEILSKNAEIHRNQRKMEVETL
jgi:hypothetical protein